MQMRGKHATSAIHLGYTKTVPIPHLPSAHCVAAPFQTHLHSLRPYPLPLPLLVKVQLGEEPVHLFVHIGFVFVVTLIERCRFSIGRKVRFGSRIKRQRLVLPNARTFSDIPDQGRRKRCDWCDHGRTTFCDHGRSIQVLCAAKFSLHFILLFLHRRWKSFVYSSPCNTIRCKRACRSRTPQELNFVVTSTH